MDKQDEKPHKQLSFVKKDISKKNHRHYHSEKDKSHFSNPNHHQKQHQSYQRNHNYQKYQQQSAKTQIVYTVDRSNQDDNSQLLLDFFTEARKFKSDFKKAISQFQSEQAHIDKIWGQWIMRNLNKQAKISHILPDPAHCRTDEFVILHMLERGCRDEATARQIYNKQIDALAVLYAKYARFLLEFSSNPSFRQPYSTNFRINSKNVIEGGNNIASVQLHTFLVEKLQRIHCGNKEELALDLFYVVFEHEMLDFVTKQYCLPPGVMKCLQSNLQVSYECMASPLNSYFSAYFSLLEADKKFGSLGNFFTGDDTIGTLLQLQNNNRNQPENVENESQQQQQPQQLPLHCQVNPPHIDSAYTQASEAMLKYLQQAEQSQKELIFVYFIAWDDCDGFKLLKTEQALPFILHQFAVPAHRHREYIVLEQRYTRPLQKDTHVIVLATSKSREKWRFALENLQKDILREFEFPEEK